MSTKPDEKETSCRSKKISVKKVTWVWRPHFLFHLLYHPQQKDGLLHFRFTTKFLDNSRKEASFLYPLFLSQQNKNFCGQSWQTNNSKQTENYHLETSLKNLGDVDVYEPGIFLWNILRSLQFLPTNNIHLQKLLTIEWWLSLTFSLTSIFPSLVFASKTNCFPTSTSKHPFIEIDNFVKNWNNCLFLFCFQSRGSLSRRISLTDFRPQTRVIKSHQELKSRSSSS